MAGNEIESLKPLKNLPKLTTLHVRSNHLTEMDFDETQMPVLENLNVRSNKIAKFEVFERIKTLPHCHTLNAKDNPCAEEVGDAAKKSILMMLYKQLKKCNKEEVTQDDRDEIINEIKEKER